MQISATARFGAGAVDHQRRAAVQSVGPTCMSRSMRTRHQAHQLAAPVAGTAADAGANRKKTSIRHDAPPSRSLLARLEDRRRPLGADALDLGQRRQVGSATSSADLKPY
jgi:hypothetical protein